MKNKKKKRQYFIDVGKFEDNKSCGSQKKLNTMKNEHKIWTNKKNKKFKIPQNDFELNFITHNIFIN